MSQPATAGIALGCIFGGMAAIYFSYRLYVKWHRRRHHFPTTAAAEMPPPRQPMTSMYGAPMPTTMMTNSPSQGSIFGDPWRGPASGSRASLGTPGSTFKQNADGTYTPRSASGLLNPAASQAGSHGGPGSSSHHGSPSSGPVDLASPSYSSDGLTPPPPAHHRSTNSGSSSPDTGAETPHVSMHPRMSSGSSTMTLKRSYASSTYKGSYASPSLSSLGMRRESYLPHSPLNRDAIQIVPPQPLGIGFGGLAQAKDERTLAFSTTSGIGSGEEIFSQGLVWGQEDGSGQNGASESGAAGAGSPSGTNWGSSIDQDQRTRYLQQGPAASTPRPGRGFNSPNGSFAATSGRSGSGSGLVRAPDSSTSGFESRSRSPAVASLAPSTNATSHSSPSIKGGEAVAAPIPAVPHLNESVSSQPAAPARDVGASPSPRQTPAPLLRPVPSHQSSASAYAPQNDEQANAAGSEEASTQAAAPQAPSPQSIQPPRDESPHPAQPAVAPTASPRIDTVPAAASAQPDMAGTPTPTKPTHPLPRPPFMMGTDRAASPVTSSASAYTNPHKDQDIEAQGSSVPQWSGLDLKLGGEWVEGRS